MLLVRCHAFQNTIPSQSHIFLNQALSLYGLSRSLEAVPPHFLPLCHATAMCHSESETQHDGLAVHGSFGVGMNHT